jgi:hypothetical protein
MLLLPWFHSVDLTIVPADVRTGKVCPNDIVLALRPNTVLVSLMLANNETGIIQPVREVVTAVHAWERNGRSGDLGQQKVLVHTDAAQVREGEVGEEREGGRGGKREGGGGREREEEMGEREGRREGGKEEREGGGEVEGGGEGGGGGEGEEREEEVSIFCCT